MNNQSKEKYVQKRGGPQIFTCAQLWRSFRILTSFGNFNSGSIKNRYVTEKPLIFPKKCQNSKGEFF